MVTAAPARTAPAHIPLPLGGVAGAGSPAAGRSASGGPRARPIPVAAYPVGTPRWVTYRGRRQRVVALHDQPALDPRLDPLPVGARRLQVELSGGGVLTLLHDGRAWYEK